MNTQAPDRRADNFAPWRSVYPTDSVGKQLVYSLERPVEPPRRNALMRAIGQQGPEPGWWLAWLWFALIALVGVVVSALTDDSGARSLSWAFGIDSVLFQVFLVIVIVYERRVARRYPDGVKSPGEESVRSLRRAALAGDDALAPVAALPVDDAAGAAPEGAAIFTVLPPEWRLLRSVKILGGVGIVIFVVFAVLLGWIDLSASTFPWEVVVLVPLGILLCLWVLLVSIRHSRACTVTVSADGLRWRKNMLPWSEIRGWTVLYLHPLNTGWTRPSAVYALIGQRASLAWLTYPPTVSANDPGVLLALLVQAQLRARGDGDLPLRDLTPGAVNISYEVGPRLFWIGRWRLLAPFDRYANGAALPRLPAALLTLALSVLVLLGVIFTPNAQRWYFGQQLTHLEASRSAIRDPLTANTLGWTMPPARYGNPKPFAFTPQGYTYPAQDCCGDGSSLAARSVGDGLVEVTIRQQTPSEFGEAGLILRASEQEQAALVFKVSPTGYWWLERDTIAPDGSLRYQDNLDSGGSFIGFGPFGAVQPIHQGHDATNRIAVLMQRSSFVFFINGQYVGRYSGSDLPRSGQVGVYVGATNIAVTFSDLLIAPA